MNRLVWWVKHAHSGRLTPIDELLAKLKIVTMRRDDLLALLSSDPSRNSSDVDRASIEAALVLVEEEKRRLEDELRRLNAS
jgi:hypothetical protein